MTTYYYLADCDTFEPADDKRFATLEECTNHCIDVYGLDALNNTHIEMSSEVDS